MKALILGTQVVQVELNQFPVSSELIWLDCPANCDTSWTYVNGQFTTPATPVITNAEILDEYASSLQSFIDSTAKTRNYDNGISCAGYINSTNSTWSVEATKFVAWRDQCWEYAINVQTQVLNGTMALPTLTDFINGLPALVW